MDKFLSIPVTSEGNTLVSCNGVLSVVGTAVGTTVVVTYKSGTVATITAGASVDFSMRNQIQDAMVLALGTGWTNVDYPIVPAQAVSGIVFS